ncbi:TadE/TadG family type IV pilus assembly protein [Terrabacter sp. 2YAF2]|uniref:TadE/TadG family type IV pilus assembly protein n=1 Tax=Terrabacter sp. 2YAF2 TaxID=3233026 RepID=UPI003F94D5CA
MAIKRHLRGRKSDRGASAVEFALIAPILVLVLGGILDFGFVFSQQIALNNAARDAARAGVVPNLAGAGLSCSAISTRLTTAITNGAVGLNSGSVVVTVTAPTSDPAATCATSTNTPCTKSSATQQLTVVASYVSSPPFPLPYLSPITLTGKGVFQCEYS